MRFCICLPNSKSISRNAGDAQEDGDIDKQDGATASEASPAANVGTPVLPSKAQSDVGQRHSNDIDNSASGVAQRRESFTAHVLEGDLQDVTKVYSFGKVLGHGQFATTRLCKDRSTGVKYACKSLSKAKMRVQADVDDVRREIQILHHLGGHPNITQLYGAYEDRKNVHLVMELCSGGELFDRIVSKGHYSEKDAAYLCRTIVRVMGHCHSLGVMHRDLKPENFLLADQSKGSALKACDFGLSVFFHPGSRFTDSVGSPNYVAPEVLLGRYSKEADIWSVGVILYILLSGCPPFSGDTDQETFRNVVKQPLVFDSDPWPRISTDAKDCVSRMLQRNPADRATADQILQHPWMREHGTASSAPLDNIILQRMQGFRAMNKLKKQALLLIASRMAPNEVAGLKAIFQAMDISRSGHITADELHEGLRRQGSSLTSDQLACLLTGLDSKQNGHIDYEEFLAATLSLSKLNRRENLLEAFQEMDTSNSGYLTEDELRAALNKHGDEVSEKELQEIISDCDQAGDGQIAFEEFVAMMTADSTTHHLSTSTMRRTMTLKAVEPP